VVFLGTWFLVPKWPDSTDMQDLDIRLAMTAGCIAVGAACIFLARWSFTKEGSLKKADRKPQ
jgi:hypothetical protein